MENPKKFLSFDGYGRYADIARIIDFNRNGKDKLSILDIGGRGNILRMFLPNDAIYYLAPNLDFLEDRNLIKGSGSQINKGDNHFDFVTSADVLEHVLPTERAAFVRESIRVAKLGIIHVAPFSSEDNVYSENYINSFYKVRTGEDHVWLKEHIDNGLPTYSEFISFLQDSGLNYVEFGNNDLQLWRQMYTFTFLTFQLPEFVTINERMNLFYNDQIYPYDNSDHVYRRGVFIAKQPHLTIPKLRLGSIGNNLRDLVFRELNEILLELAQQAKTETQQARAEAQQAKAETVAVRKSRSFRFGFYALHPWRLPGDLWRRGKNGKEKG